MDGSIPYKKNTRAKSFYYSFLQWISRNDVLLYAITDRGTQFHSELSSFIGFYRFRTVPIIRKQMASLRFHLSLETTILPEKIGYSHFPI